MDIATLIGIMISIGAITWAMWEGTHGHLETFYSTEGFVLVLGGSFAAVLLSMPLRAVLDVFGYIKNWLLAREPSLESLIREMLSAAELARRDGVLALEGVVRKQSDPFLKKALMLAVDGTDPEMLEHTLQIEIEALGERHKKGKKFFELMGKYGPGFGLTATLIGQVCMFRNMGGDSSAIGKSLAVALLGTLYGCLICNVICGPIADKLGIRSADEQFRKQMIIVGVKSIQAGDNPRIVELKLHSFLSEKQRKALQKGAPEAAAGG